MIGRDTYTHIVLHTTDTSIVRPISILFVTIISSDHSLRQQIFHEKLLLNLPINLTKTI